MNRTVRRFYSFLLPCLALLAATMPAARAAEERKPNTLTPREITDGWVLLYDGASSFGWTPRGDAQWQSLDGTLTPSVGTGKGVLATNPEFADYRLRLDFWLDEKANSGVFQRCSPSGEVTGTNAYEVNLFDAHPQWPTGSINEIARAKSKVTTVGRWNTLEVEARGKQFKVRVNGKTTVDALDPKFARGSLALQYNGEGVVRFRSIRLQPLSTRPIFNGKDLTGWKVLPNHASVYSVTREGWLNVKNGNGEIQSEEQFGDFVLQLGVISNGEHLNSGVFVRSRPGEFWNGYEAQIRNQWQGEDRTKPVDFGTGGLYFYQPTRRVISSDHEWFTYTILAAGRHFTTWVNGVMTADWTDPRPPKENAREGFRGVPGVIGLQGHDPTTDLSFRDLKIAPLPAPREPVK
jgi:hypothetical protein